MDLNLFGTVLPTMVFAEVMVGQGKGSIINISSESSLRPLTRVVGYGCAKAAINNFTQYMAGELAIKFGEGLRVNAMAPGFFLTEQNRALMSNPDGSPSDRCNTIVAHTPLRKTGGVTRYFTMAGERRLRIRNRYRDPHRRRFRRFLHLNNVPTSHASNRIGILAH